MTPLKYLTLLTITSCLAGASAFAQDAGALVDALIKKGILTDQEAEEIRAEMTRDFTNTSAGKINLNSSVTELKLYGDLRLRYQYENKDLQVDPSPVGVHQDRNEDDRSPSGTQQGRWRFRLRLNADFRLTDQFSGGVELQTTQASDSANQSYENGFNDYNIFISKAWINWTPNDWLSVSAGKFSNPFYTTDLVWDGDINPNGLAEVIAFHKLFKQSGEAGYSKDGKSVIAGEPTLPPWELTLVAGQFIYDDNPEGAFDNDSSTDAYLFQTQLIAAWNFANGSKLTFAPAWFTYINGSLSGLDNNNPFNDRDDPADDASKIKFADVSGATRNLNLILAPGDYSFKLGSLKAKFYWDFSYNIEGRKRTEDIYNLAILRNNLGQSSDDDVIDPDDRRKQHSNVDDYAYLAGVILGENKKRGDWSVLANWRQTGIGAVDPNLNDSDFALSELNTRGFKISGSYNFTDFAVGTVSWMHAWNLRDTLAGGEATGGNAIADSNVIDVVQVDFSVKF